MTDISQIALTYIKKVTALAVSSMILVTAPAMATGASAPIDIADQVADKNKDVTPLGAADEDFRALFASWSKRDDKTMGKVAIPSRMPVDDKFRVSSRYGYRGDPFNGRRKMHRGIDMAAPIGTPIYATADGVVGRAQWVRGYGKYIEIEHGGDIQTRYGHLSRMNVAPNQRVKRGDLIAFMGSTGRSTGSHLHYEVRIDGKAVNPEPFLRSSSYLLAMQDRLNQGQGGPEEDDAE